jgi:prepilin-type N-terminal cleavage/methylation domain-containing protein
MEHKTWNKKNASGFTLLEMVVALAVFSTVIAISLSSLLSLSDAQKKAVSFRNTQDNLNFALEKMARAIRTGSSYNSEDSTFTYRNWQGDSVVYQLNNNRIEESFDGGANFLPLTSPEINIERLIFYIRGAEHADGIQPIVTIVVGGVSGAKQKIESKINLQFTVSQRLLEP